MEKTAFMKQKQKVSKINFYFGRFLLLRYLLAAFFFSNIYWTLMLVMAKSFYCIVPIGLLVLSLFGIAEHLKLYGDTSNTKDQALKYSLLYQKCQLFLNAGLILATAFDSSYKSLFPFLLANSLAKGILVLVLLTGIVLSWVVISRINRIRKNQDKYFGYLQEFNKLSENESE